METVNLDELNEKLKIKEFKATNKALKSKELAVRKAALDKVAAERRYLTQGDALLPILETLVAKKNSYDLCEVSIQGLKAIVSATSEITNVDILARVLEFTGSLDCLQTLFSLISYKEEVKKIKMPKGSTEPPPFVPENDVVVRIRHVAIEAIFCIFESVFNAPESDLKSRMPGIANIFSNLIAATDILRGSLISPEESIKTKAIIDTKRIFSILSHICKVDSASLEGLLPTTTFMELSEFIRNEAVAYSALEFCEIISTNSAGLQAILSHNTILTSVTEVLSRVSSKMLEFQAPPEPVAANDKGKGAKKDDKKKGAAAAVPTEVVQDPDKGVKTDCVSCAAKCALILRYSYDSGRLTVTTESAKTVVDALCQIIKNTTVHEIARLEKSMVDVVDQSCGAVGALARVSEDCRVTTVSVAEALVSTIQQSAKIVGIGLEPPLAAVEDLLARQTQLRAYAEKAFLNIAVSACSQQSTSSKWPSSRKWTLNLQDVEPLIAIIIEMAVQTGDEDLSNRCLRVLSLFLESCPDRMDFITKFKLDASFVTKVSAIAQQRATASLEILQGQSPLPSDAPVTAPNSLQTLFHCFLLLDSLLPISAEAVNAYCTKDRVTGLRDIIYLAGPTCCNVGITELKVSMRSLLSSNWAMSSWIEADDQLLLRPLILDVLTIICASDTQYRKCDGPLPVEPGVAVPNWVSPTLDSALIVARYAGDATCALLLTDVEATVDPQGHLTATRRGVDEAHNPLRLASPVLASALAMFDSVGRTGALGALGALESLVDAAMAPGQGLQSTMSSEESATTKCALQWVSQASLSSLVTSQLSALGAEVVDVAKFAWTRPLYFDECVSSDPTSALPTHISSLHKSFQLWPHVALCSALVGTLSDRRVEPKCLSLAVRALSSLTRLSDFSSACQPVVTDHLASVVLSVGGGIALTSSAGLLGTLRTVDSGDDETLSSEHPRAVARDLLQDLLHRGTLRQQVWSEILEKARAAAAADPKGAKGKDKGGKGKDPKADKGKGGKGAAPAASGPVVEEVKYWTELQEGETDPNHGPDMTTWRRLLDVQADDSFARIGHSTALISAVQGGESSTVIDLVGHGVSVNSRDSRGAVALMYALLIDNAKAITSLLEAGAERDVIDDYGNPLVKYAFATLDRKDLSCLTVPATSDDSKCDQSPFKVTGSSQSFGFLTDTSIDINASDNEGNFPIHLTVGLGSLTLHFLGRDVTVTPCGYHGLHDVLRSNVETLIAMGARINACNRDGMTALHIASAHGDENLVTYLLSLGASPNIRDSAGYLPMHYCAGSCPHVELGSPEALWELLWNASSHRPVTEGVFNDSRTGKSPEEKYMIDVQAALDEVLEEDLFPSCITKSRFTPEMLIQLRVAEDISLLQLILSAHELRPTNIAAYTNPDKMARLKFAMHVLNRCSPEDAQGLVGAVDIYNTNSLHSAALLLRGRTSQIYLTDKERRSKRVKKYASLELHLLEIIFTSGLVDINAVSGRQVTLGRYPCFENDEHREPTQLFDGWTALHAAVANSNADLTVTLLGKADIESHDYLTYAAGSVDCNQEVAVALVDRLLLQTGASKEALALSALRRRNPGFLRALFERADVDINNILDLPSTSCNTSLFSEALRGQHLDSIRIFAVSSQKPDILRQDPESGLNSIQTAIQLHSDELLTVLVDLNRDQALEFALSSSDSQGCWLVSVEKENVDLSHKLGIIPKDTYESPCDIQSNEQMDLYQQSSMVELQFKIDGQTVESNMNEDDNAMISNAEPQLDQIESSIQDQEITGLESDMAEMALQSSVPNEDDKKVAPVKIEPDPQILEQLQWNNRLLQLFLPLVNQSDIVARDFHAHRCFFDGILYNDFVSQQ